jgi:HPt (histidine-containing phosphotransfer) domain-containing protein
MALDKNALNELRELDPDGSSGLVVQIIESYLSDSTKLIQQIRTAFSANDIVTLTRNAHTLKSTSLTVGATRVGEIAKELEMACKSGTLQVLPLFLTALTAEYAAAERLLKAECVAPQSPPAAERSMQHYFSTPDLGDRRVSAINA